MSKTKREKIRAILETPYVRLSLIVIIFLLSGLAVVYLFLTIVAAYLLATSIGNANAQLAVGLISAMGTVTSAIVAYLLYRNSIGGAEISIALEDHTEVETTWRIHRTPLPASELQKGATQELFEELLFKFEVVMTNTGVRSGAMADIELKLMNPASVILKPNAREDRISLAWEGQFVTRETYRPTPLRSGQINAISLGSNESVVIIVTVDLMLSDTEIGVRPPQNDWLGIQQRTPYFEFKFQWRTASRGTLKTEERSFKIKPKFQEPVQEGPAQVLK